MTDNSIAPDVFDRLRMATAADPTELAELCRDYLVEARHTLAQLHAAFAQQDAEQVRDRAHYLRGSSLVLGAAAVAQSCATLELMGRQGDLHDVARLLDQTSAALHEVERELAKRLGPDVVPTRAQQRSRPTFAK